MIWDRNLFKLLNIEYSMVKPFEEEQKLKLDLKKAVTLFEIIQRYVKDNYKQFGTQDLTKPFISTSDEVIGGFVIGNRDYEISIHLRSLEKRQPNISVGVHAKDLSKSTYRPVVYHTFKIISNPTPKEIAKSAKTIFAWIKKELDKIN